MLIKIENIIKNYVNDELVTPALRGVTFNVHSGEFVAIMGASGSGKSTLMHIVGFLDKSTSGKYFFEDKDIKKFDDKKLAKIRNKKIGFVFQTYNLLAKTSVLDNILLPTIYTPGVDRKAVRKKAEKLLHRVSLSHRTNYLPNQLSGGERQKVAIVRALINDPILILADEPTGNLDSKSGQEVMEVLQDLNNRGNTILMITHEKYVAQCAKRILVLRDGKIISDSKDFDQRLASKGLDK